MSLLPLQPSDRYSVMEWRNEQLDILRQVEPLTESDQDKYFENVVARWYREIKPEGVLFGIHCDSSLIGYGGLVHIDWDHRNAEVSFLLADADCQSSDYVDLFTRFLQLIQAVARTLKLKKVFCVGYDQKRYRFSAFNALGFKREAILRNHVRVQDRLCNVLIHSQQI
ncbi:MAG: GNAT family N-acetyltransferase [Pseudomonadota bacterium]